MAKSVTHAWVGLLVKDGCSHSTSAPGLRWNEDYVDPGVSDVDEMVFGTGQADVAAFAAAQPLRHAPGARWSYSSGTGNLVARMCREALTALAPCWA